MSDEKMTHQRMLELLRRVNAKELTRPKGGEAG